ncbi:MAG: SRPBCC domain-containing protein [Bacteroidia bacterium]
MKALLKEHKIHAPKQMVYAALTQIDLLAAWSRDSVEMDTRVGGEFSLWGGTVFGRNVELSPDKIVQTWQEDNWDEPSKVIITLKENNGVTTMQVLHNHIPDSSFIAVNRGWELDYLRPLKEFVEEEMELV